MIVAYGGRWKNGILGVSGSNEKRGTWKTPNTAAAYVGVITPCQTTIAYQAVGAIINITRAVTKRPAVYVVYHRRNGHGHRGIVVIVDDGDNVNLRYLIIISCNHHHNNTRDKTKGPGQRTGMIKTAQRHYRSAGPHYHVFVFFPIIC